MAYTTINDLPIVQVDDLSGNEYIMVTDEDTNISSKFTLESLVQYTGATVTIPDGSRWVIVQPI